MSGAIPTHIPIRQRLLRDQSRTKIIALSAAIVLTALALTLLVLDSADSPTANNEQPVTQAANPPTSTPSASSVARGQLYVNPSTGYATPHPDSRSDGGPDESVVAGAIAGQSR